MINPGCCCGCTFADNIFLDPDGTVITEATDEILIQDSDNASTQIVDAGAPFNCKGEPRAEQPPCREVQCDAYIDETVRFAKQLTVDMGAGPGPFTGFIGVTGEMSGGFSGYTSANLLPFASAFVDVTGSGTDLTVTCSASGYSAVYTVTGVLSVHGWDSTGGINWRDRSIFTLTLGAHSAHAWPASVQLYANDFASTVSGPYALYHCRATANIWWRFYDATTFDPDGSTGPQLGYKFCSQAHEYLTTDLNSATVNSGGPNAEGFLYVALQQGTTRAITAMAGPQFSRVNDDWLFQQFTLRPWSDLTWATFGTDPLFGLNMDAFVPDLSNGADPITFGICARVATSWKSTFERLRILYRFDELCLQIKH